MLDLEQVIVASNEPPKLKAHFPTGAMLDVQGVEGKLKSRLVGMMPPAYLFLATPKMAVSVRQKLTSGVSLLVRYVYQGSVYAFQSQIVGLTNQPVALLVISYPPIVSNQEFRKARRYSCYLNTEVQKEENKFKGAILDISKVGCRLLCKSSSEDRVPDVQMGESISLRFATNYNQPPICLNAIVRNMSTSPEITSLGLEFMDAQSKAEASLAVFLGALELSDHMKSSFKADH